MKKIKKYEYISVEEGVRLFKENLEALYDLAFGNAVGVWINRGKLDNIMFPSVAPFLSGNERFSFCARVTERYPTDVPEGVDKLPEPFLAYLMMGPLPEDKRPSAEERKERPLWLFLGDYWDCTTYAIGDSDKFHYALDVSTAYAKRVWPEIVEAMEYQEPPKWKVGDTVQTLNEIDKGIIYEVRDDKCTVSVNCGNFYTFRASANKVKPWTPGYGYLPDGNSVPPPPEGFVMMEENEPMPPKGAPMGLCDGRGVWFCIDTHYGEMRVHQASNYGSIRAYARKVEPKLQLREGGFYVSRNGSIRGPMTRSDSAMYPWKDPDTYTYTDQGIFGLGVENCQKDLVREVRVTDLNGSPLKVGE